METDEPVIENVPRRINEQKKQPEKYSLAELKKRINAYEPEPILDFINRKIKTILLVFFLLLAGVLFTSVGLNNLTKGEGWQEYVGHLVLGAMLLICGVYFSVFIVLIWLGREGYNYEDLPDMDNN